jgi:predicted metal-dependent peptidase
MYDSQPLPWYVILRRMVNTSIRTVMENNVNVRNRRAGSSQILPGYITKPLLDIGVVWDVSGSCMDNETQGHFVNECNALVKAGANLTIYYCDAQVEHVQKVTKKLVPEKYEIRGGGGTFLDLGIKRAIADGNHIIIQLTDGYMNYTLTKADLKGRKVISCTTGDLPPTHYGVNIKIDTKEKK